MKTIFNLESYASFDALKANETVGTDYRIRVRCGRSGIAVMAIHGGGIEPGTTEIAEAVADKEHTFYSFSGLKLSGNTQLHISSRKFDEPLGLNIARHAKMLITVHGCKDRKGITYVGGRHRQLKEKIKRALTVARFPVIDGMRFPGINPKNICNKSRSGMGVQLEISMGMRILFFEDITRLYRKRITPCFFAYVHALQKAIQ